MKFVLATLLTFTSLLFSGTANAQNNADRLPKPRFEIGAATGTLILSKIPEVVDNVPPVTLRFGLNSSAGIIEATLMHARGNDMKWRSGLISYRFDLDDLDLPFHALIGLHADMYQVYDGQKTSYGGGWHYGGGAHLQIVDNLQLRADFVNRFGPGRSLLVLVGLALGFGSAGNSP